MNPPAFLTVREVAKALRLGVSTTYALIDRGEIPAVQVGSTLRVPARWIEERERQALAAVKGAPDA